MSQAAIVLKDIVYLLYSLNTSWVPYLSNCIVHLYTFSLLLMYDYQIVLPLA